MSPGKSTLLDTFSGIYAGGLKVRMFKGREVIITACESTEGKMIDAVTKEVLWHSYVVGGNPHSVELTPNGVLIFASTSTYDQGGCRLTFFNAEDSSKMKELRFDDAHGVLYDPDTDLVFAVGENKLRAFKVSLNSKGKPVVLEDTSYALTLDSNGAHDLQPVYGNPDRFWITTLTKVYQYSVSEKKLYKVYDGSDKLYSVANVKGIGSLSDGSVIYSYPNGYAFMMSNGIMNNWTSNEVVYLKKTAAGYTQYKITDNSVGIYKLRVYNSAYQ